MRSLAILGLAVGVASTPGPAWASHGSTWRVPGPLVEVAVDVDGRTAPLYPARDGSGRFYLEAREGSRYDVRLTNRSGERVGVVLAVDGLNVVSGQPEPLARAGRRPGRMYVLDPWDVTVVRGWRSSLDAVQRFTFVDERSSYAARSGQFNRRVGWIEVAVYRERQEHVRRRPLEDRIDDRDAGRAGAAEAAPTAPAAPAPGRGDAYAPGEDEQKAAPSAEARSKRGDVAARPPAGSYPGTGWGPRTSDPAVLVQFDPQPHPAQTVTVRYEYRSALRALGILPGRPDRDRLSERERGGDGFARPPVW
jgi:hypothetical protein